MCSRFDQEWLSSVNRHLKLYKAFGWDTPHFAHLPLIMGAGGRKLSKRDAGVSVGDYIVRPPFHTPVGRKARSRSADERFL